MNNVIVKKKRGRGRPPKAKNIVPTVENIDFSSVGKLSELEIDPRMMESMKTGINSVDQLFSHERGVPCATNIMAIGDPGVGKTTVLLDILATIQNKGRECLFISGEMGRKQMFKYAKRFPQFNCVETLFMSDFIEFNTKDVIEQILDIGYDLVLIDSMAEVIDGIRDDNSMDRKTAESFLIDLMVKNNKGENEKNLYTTFLAIQQVTKGGEFVGSNKLKHLTDAMIEMRRDSERDGGNTFMKFVKNRNGEVDKRMNFHLGMNKLEYGLVTGVEE